MDHLRPVRDQTVVEGTQNPEERQSPDMDESFKSTPQPTGRPIVDSVRPYQQPSVSPPMKEPLELQAGTNSPSAATPTTVPYYPSHFISYYPMYAQLDNFHRGGDVVFDITYCMKYTFCVYYYMYVALHMSEVHVYVFM